MIALIALSTWALAQVGKRGYGERAEVQSVGYARALGRGAWDVSQWVNAFVTTSGAYQLAHRGEPNLYAFPPDDEVDGVISAAGGGAVTTRIPLYSSRSFLQRARMGGPTIAIAVARIGDPWAQRDGLELRLQEPLAGLVQARLVHGDRVYRLTITPTTPPGLVVYDSGTTLADMRAAEPRRLALSSFDESPDGTYSSLLAPLLLEAESDRDGGGAWTTQRDPRSASVYLYAEQPPAFQLVGDGFAQRGRMLYRVDIELRASGDAEKTERPAAGEE
jgi:hypothetical protein